MGLYALSFAAPLASGVVGMVAAGMVSDRRGPVQPLIWSMLLFTFGLVVCAVPPSMELLVVGRVLQGLGGGALTVGLYVVVGLVYPAALQPAVFASFAAAWVLPALFGPGLAALVSEAFGWRWVFGGSVIFVGMAAALIARTLRSLTAPAEATATPIARLAWAVVAAVAVLAVELLGSTDGPRRWLAGAAFVLVIVSLARMLPSGALVARRGLPAVIATRGLLSATFFCSDAYIVFVLQEQWGVSTGRAGLALTGVGIAWALGSQIQSRLGDRLSHETAMRFGSLATLAGTAGLAGVVHLDWHPALAGASYVLAGLGMGFGYPRTSVAMLAASTDRDRGFNSSALTIADSIGAALALSLAGVVFAYAASPFLAVFLLAIVIGVASVAAAART